MKKDLRYKIQHAGDYFVGALSCAIDAAKSAGKGCARGVILTYDINELKRKKKELARKLGERYVALKEKDSKIKVPADKKIDKLMTEMEKLQQNIESLVTERAV